MSGYNNIDDYINAERDRATRLTKEFLKDPDKLQLCLSLFADKVADNESVGNEFVALVEDGDALAVGHFVLKYLTREAYWDAVQTIDTEAA